MAPFWPNFGYRDSNSWLIELPFSFVINPLAMKDVYRRWEHHCQVSFVVLLFLFSLNTNLTLRKDVISVFTLIVVYVDNLISKMLRDGGRLNGIVKAVERWCQEILPRIGT